jgi:hypothetical protein
MIEVMCKARWQQMISRSVCRYMYVRTSSVLCGGPGGALKLEGQSKSAGDLIEGCCLGRR